MLPHAILICISLISSEVEAFIGLLILYVRCLFVSISFFLLDYFSSF